MLFIHVLILVFLNTFHPTLGVGDRVLIEVSRGKVVAGEIIQQEGDVVVIRERNGELVTIDLDEVTRVVPLVTGGEEVTGAVELRDGRRFYGTILKDEFEEVILKVEGVKMTFMRDQVQRVYIDPPFEESYELMLNSISLTNESQFRFLIEWLLHKDQIDIAKSHLDESMLETPAINSLRRRLDLKMRGRGLPESQEKKNPVALSVPSESKKLSRILTQEEVNLIRAYESSSKQPPPLTFSEDVREKLLHDYSDDPRLKSGTFLRNRVIDGSDQELFQIIRELRAEKYYSELVSIDEPDSLRRFREDVHDDWLINRCGTNACHGGIDSGIFLLHQKPIHDDRARYANLLTLERLEVDPAWPILNFNEPDQSLLIQYGLHRKIADKPHPEVKSWNPVPELGRIDEYQATIAWIRSMRQVPRPQYPIEYALPIQKGEVPTK